MGGSDKNLKWFQCAERVWYNKEVVLTTCMTDFHGFVNYQHFSGKHTLHWWKFKQEFGKWSNERCSSTIRDLYTKKRNLYVLLFCAPSHLYCYVWKTSWWGWVGSGDKVLWKINREFIGRTYECFIERFCFYRSSQENFFIYVCESICLYRITRVFSHWCGNR